MLCSIVKALAKDYPDVIFTDVGLDGILAECGGRITPISYRICKRTPYSTLCLLVENFIVQVEG